MACTTGDKTIPGGFYISWRFRENRQEWGNTPVGQQKPSYLLYKSVILETNNSLISMYILQRLPPAAQCIQFGSLACCYPFQHLNYAVNGPYISCRFAKHTGIHLNCEENKLNSWRPAETDRRECFVRARKVGGVRSWFVCAAVAWNFTGPTHPLVPHISPNSIWDSLLCI
jgi:hypothetical protein